MQRRSSGSRGKRDCGGVAVTAGDIAGRHRQREGQFAQCLGHGHINLADFDHVVRWHRPTEPPPLLAACPRRNGVDHGEVDLLTQVVDEVDIEPQSVPFVDPLGQGASDDQDLCARRLDDGVGILRDPLVIEDARGDDRPGVGERVESRTPRWGDTSAVATSRCGSSARGTDIAGLRCATTRTSRIHRAGTVARTDRADIRTRCASGPSRDEAIRGQPTRHQ